MEIKTTVDGNTATIAPSGKLTVNTASDLNAAIDALSGSVCDIDIDLTEVDYVASAGLRVFVAADKLASKRGGTMRLLHPCDKVYEVLEMTGLSEIISIVE